MEFTVTLSKMSSYLSDPVSYLLSTDEDFVKMNMLLGRQVKLEFLNEKYCASCGNKFENLYRMGFCYNCFYSKPEAGESIIRPELSQAHLGIEDRDLEFEKGYQLQPHVVYIANSGGIKVGVTRKNQKTTRWVDQGASQAIVLAETTNRYEAGIIEVDLKQHISDKTAWQRMLKDETPEVNLVDKKKELGKILKADLQKFISEDDTVYDIEYPVNHYPTKVKSINLDKQNEINATLQGIRGQYLIFEGGASLNVRGYTGYRLKISF